MNTIIKLEIKKENKEFYYSDVFSLFNFNFSQKWLDSEICEIINNSVFEKGVYEDDEVKIKKVNVYGGFPDVSELC